MLSTNIPKPGSYIKVFIGGYGDEKYYKPIRQDFIITNIKHSCEKNNPTSRVELQFPKNERKFATHNRVRKCASVY